MGGGVADTLSDQMERDGVEVPKAIADQPLLDNSLLCYLNAFYELDTERNHGMALVRIPWSKIVGYGRHYGFDIDELVFFIRKMDDAHLARLKGSSGGGTGGTGTVVSRPPRPD